MNQNHLQDSRVSQSIVGRYGNALLDRVLTVCSGLSLVSINLTHFVFPDKRTAEVRMGLLGLFWPINTTN